MSRQQSGEPPDIQARSESGSKNGPGRIPSDQTSAADGPMERRVANLERLVHKQAVTIKDQGRRLLELENDREAPPQPQPGTLALQQPCYEGTIQKVSDSSDRCRSCKLVFVPKSYAVSESTSILTTRAFKYKLNSRTPIQCGFRRQRTQSIFLTSKQIPSWLGFRAPSVFGSMWTPRIGSEHTLCAWSHSRRRISGWSIHQLEKRPNPSGRHLRTQLHQQN